MNADRHTSHTHLPQKMFRDLQIPKHAILGLLFLFTLLLIVSDRVLAADATLALTPSAQSVNIDDAVTVDVAISGVGTELAGVAMIVDYDAARLAFDSAETTQYLATTNRNVTCSPVMESAGQVALACASAGEGAGVTADGTVATLTFTAIGAGSADLTLATQLADTAVPPNALAADTINATIEIGVPTAISLNQLQSGQQRALLIWLLVLLALTLIAAAYLIRQRKRHGLFNVMMVFVLLVQLSPVPPMVTTANAANNVEDVVESEYQPRFAASETCEPSPQPSPSGRGSKSLFSPSRLWERGSGGEGFVPTNLDCDADVDSADLRLIADRWGCESADACYLAAYDLDSNNAIDLLDMAWVGNDFDIAPPVLTIDTPAAASVLTGTTVSVSGTVTDDHAITAVSVNGVAATVGVVTFSADVPATGGTQLLTVAAMDELGRTTFAERLVTIDNGAPFIDIAFPKDRQAVYTTTPTIESAYRDFESVIDVTSFSAILSDAGGGSVDVSADLTPTSDGASGTLSTPLIAEQTYTLTIQIADDNGNIGTATSTFYVARTDITPPVEPENAGWVSGVVYDSAECNTHLEGCQPLTGAEVTLLRVDLEAMDAIRAEQAALYNTPIVDHEPLDSSAIISATETVTGTIVTGPDGFFAFPIADSAVYFVRVEKDGFTYAQREVEIVREKSTATNRIYLTGLDSAETQCTDAGCTHQNSDNSIQLDIPAGAIPSGETYPINATLFENVEFLPSGELPPGTWETYAFNLGGDSEITFTMPITVRVANTIGFAAESRIPLGYWNQVTQAWEHAGTGVVDATGQWVEMQVTHFSNYDCNSPIAELETPDTDIEQKDNREDEDEDEDCEAGEGGCFIKLHSGTLEEWIDLPSLNVLGESVAPRLEYASNRAYPTAIIDLQVTLAGSPSVTLDDIAAYELYIEGTLTDQYVFQTDYTAEGEIGRFRYWWDGRNAQGDQLPSGTYEYAVKFSFPFRAQYCYALNEIFGNPPDCENGALNEFVDDVLEEWVYGTVTLDEQVDSSLGAGWVWQGQQRLTSDEDGNLAITDGQQTARYYFPQRDAVINLAFTDNLTNPTKLVWADGAEGGSSIFSVDEEVAQAWTQSYLELPLDPKDVALSPDDTIAYALGPGRIDVVDLATNVISATHLLGATVASRLAISADNSTAYVTMRNRDRLYTVDLATGSRSFMAVGDGPYDLVLSADNSVAYVALRNADSVAIVNLMTNTISNTIPVGNDPFDIALAADGTTLYTVNNLDDTVSVIDLASETVTATIPVGNAPTGIAISSDGTTAYVTADRTNPIDVLDLATQTVSETIVIADLLQGIELIDDTTAYVYSGAGVYEVDLTTGDHAPFTSIGVSGAATRVAVAADANSVYIAYGTWDALIAVDRNDRNGMTVNALTELPETVQVAPTGDEAYLTSYLGVGGSIVTFADLASGDETFVAVDNQPTDSTLSADGSTLYVPNSTADQVSVIDTASQTIIDTIAVDNPSGVAHDADGFLYVSGTDASNAFRLAQIDLATEAITSIPLSFLPSKIALSPNGTFAYVINVGSSRMMVVDLETLSEVAVHAVSSRPTDVVAALSGDFVYVLGETGESISVYDVDSDSVTATIDLPNNVEPRALAISADSTTAYVLTEFGLFINDLTSETFTHFMSNGYCCSDAGDIALSIDAPPQTIYSLSAADYSTLTFDVATETFTRTHKDGRQIHFNADGTHDFTVHPDGKREQFSYNGDGSIAGYAVFAPSAVAADWTWTFSYSDGKLDAITDSAGRSVDFTINAAGQLAAVTQPDGATRQFSYSANHLLSHQTNERGFVTSYTYDDFGRVTTIADPIREIYDPVTGTSEVTQTIRTITPSETGQALLNELATGSFDVPTTGLAVSADLRDSVSYGRGERSGLTNAFGSWTEVVDGIGRTTTYERDAANNILQHTAPDGDCETFSYDAMGNPLSHSVLPSCASRSAQTWTTTYESRFNQIKTMTDPLGNTTTYVYDYETGAGDAGNVVAIIQPAVANEFGMTVTPTLTYTYNALGLLASETNARGTVTQYSYTTGDEVDDTFASGVTPVAGLLTQIVRDAGGDALTTTYRQFDALGNAQLEIAAGNTLTTSYTFDSMGRVLTITDAEGKVTLNEYDAQGNRTRLVKDYTADGTTGRNVETTFSYDAEGRLLEQRSEADGVTLLETRQYDVNGVLAAITDGNGNTTQFVYDSADQLTQIIDGAGYTQTLTYNADGSLATVTDADGYVTAYSYDGYGRRISETVDVGGLELTTLIAYDLNDNVTMTTDAAGLVTCVSYDGHDRLITETTDCGNRNLTKTTAYDVNGNPVYATDWRGVVTYSEYDALDRVTLTRADDGGLDLEMTRTYNAAGLPATVTDQRGTITAQSYDALNRLTSLCQDTAGLNLCTSYEYDRLNQTSSVTDPNGIVTEVVYNDFGKPTSEIKDANGLAATTQLAYDDVLNLVQVVDDGGNTTGYSFDARNDLSAEQFADGTSIQYSYDGRGNEIGRILQDSTTFTNTFDGASRRTAQTFSTGDTQTFTYDAMNRITQADQTSNGHTTRIAIEFDVLGSPLSSTQTVDALAWTTTFAPDYTTGAVTTTYPSGAVRVHTVDALQRLDAVQRGDGSTIANMTYFDALGTQTTSFENGILTTVARNEIGRINTIEDTLRHYAYGYDDAGNRTYQQRLHDTDTPADVYSYDGLYQLAQVWYGADAADSGSITSATSQQSYSHDTLYNRQSLDGTAYSADSMNRYTSVGGDTLTYDVRGNVTVDATHTYSYDLLNRQTGVDGDQYVYDAFNRRVAKVVDGVTTYFVYDEQLRVLESYDATNTLQNRYTYGAGIDEPLLLETGGNSFYYHQDAIGNVTELSDASGNLVEQMQYDVFGSVTIRDSGGTLLLTSSVGNPYLFQARRYDSESGNYYFRNRMYAVDIGRFLQADPLGMVDGVNVYQFVGNRPTTQTDPLGLFAVKMGYAFEGIIAIAPVFAVPGLFLILKGFASNEIYDCCASGNLECCKKGKGKIEVWATAKIGLAVEVSFGVSVKLKPDLKQDDLAKSAIERLKGTKPQGQGVLSGLDNCPSRGCNGAAESYISLNFGSGFGYSYEIVWPLYPKLGSPQVSSGFGYTGATGGAIAAGVRGYVQCDGRLGDVFELF